MVGERTSRFLGVAAAAVAVVFVVIGLRRTHKVYDNDVEEFGLLGFRRISARQLVVDTTFGGVTRRDAKLFSTYDRQQPRGKRSCPT